MEETIPRATSGPAPAAPTSYVSRDLSPLCGQRFVGHRFRQRIREYGFFRLRLFFSFSALLAPAFQNSHFAPFLPAEVAVNLVDILATPRSTNQYQRLKRESKVRRTCLQRSGLKQLLIAEE